MGSLHQTKGADWEHLASDYTKFTNQTSRGTIGMLLERGNALYPFSQAEGILDNGCGSGPAMSRLIEDYGSALPSTCSLACADFSEAMIRQVENIREQAASDSPWKRVQTKVQNAMDLNEIAEGSVTHITAGWVYFMTPDPLKCLSESRRVLKEDGVLALSSWEDSQWMQLTSAIVKVRPDKKLPQIPAEWRSDSAVKAEMQKAGFRDCESHRVRVQMKFETHEGFVDFALTKMPHITHMTSDMSAEELASFRALMVEEMKGMCPDAPGSLEGMSLVGVGRK
ncbi:hypothetical protein B0A50_01854 [Salinomyces thailandicus]|uniref:Methyltransferase type 11 domain-containing protein n=1 Tax=Salinomyces thailandicus TaxID=706561 RepID=A0A4U0UBB7_9PEZI|nr:hypothetical protein B0A50_01854 [Salinomyces thailandica]